MKGKTFSSLVQFPPNGIKLSYHSFLRFHILVQLIIFIQLTSNVIYKLVLHILVKRLKDILSKHISHFQSVLIPGIWIVENTLITQEVVTFMKNKSRDKCGFIRLKLYMQKAYDNIKWSFFWTFYKLWVFA